MIYAGFRTLNSAACHFMLSPPLRGVALVYQPAHTISSELAGFFRESAAGFHVNFSLGVIFVESITTRFS